MVTVVGENFNPPAPAWRVAVIEPPPPPPELSVGLGVGETAGEEAPPPAGGVDFEEHAEAARASATTRTAREPLHPTCRRRFISGLLQSPQRIAAAGRRSREYGPTRWSACTPAEKWSA